MLSVEMVEKSKKNEVYSRPISPEAREALVLAAKRGDSIYDLTLIGVAEHTLAVLDNRAGIIEMGQLLALRPEELLKINGIGVVGVQELLDKLPEYHKIKSSKRRYENASKGREYLARLIRTHCPGKHGKFV